MHASARRLTNSPRIEGLPGVAVLEPVRDLADAKPHCEGSELRVPAEVYARLLSLADQAPLDALAVAPRTLDRARTLGYNEIGQVRCATPNRLVADFGVEHADELLRALYSFGLRQQHSGSWGREAAE